MYLKQVNKILLTSLISICTANVAFASDKTTSDITHEVTSYEQSAYGETKGYVATKSSTGSKMDIDIQEIPQSVSVITNDMMKDRAKGQIQSIISYDSSITFPYGDNTDYRANYGKIRGLDLIYNSTFLDGLKQTKYGASIPFVLPYALERIEILKGPSSVLYGASGPGGLLNLQSKKAKNDNSKEIGISYGSHNAKSVFTDINHKASDDLLVRITSEYSKADSQLELASSNSYFINPTLTYLINDASSLDVSASIAQQANDGLGLGFSGSPSNLVYHNSAVKNFDALNAAYFILSGGGSLTKSNFVNSANDLNNIYLKDDMYIGLADYEQYEKNQKNISVVFNQDINDKIKFKSSLRVQDIDADTYYSQPSASGLLALTGPIVSQDLTTLPMEFIESESELTSIVLDNNLQYSWGNDNIENSSIFGLDFQYSEGKKQRTKAVQYNFDFKDPKPHQSITTTDVLDNYHTSDATQIGLYASNNMKLNSQYILSTSLRYDEVKNKYKSATTNTTTNQLEHNNGTQNDDNVSGRLGLVYLMKNGMAPYISYSTSFQTNFGTTADGKNFVPSKGKQIETGIKYKPKNINMFLTLSVFDLELKDVVEADSSTPGEKIQNSNQNIKGLEINVTATPSENTNLIFSFSKLNSEYKESAIATLKGKEVSEVPEFTASVWADYTFNKTKLGKIKIGTGIKHVGEYTLYQGDYLDPTTTNPAAFKTDAFTTVDALLATDYEAWNIALNITNLLNKQINIGNNSLMNTPIPERTFKLTASYKF